MTEKTNSNNDFKTCYNSILETVNFFSPENIKESMGKMIGSVEMLLQNCKDKLYNMPDSLQSSSSSGEVLQRRIDYIEGWVEDLKNICLEGMMNTDGDLPEPTQVFLEVMEEINNCEPEL
jgi:hypothetical protein